MDTNENMNQNKNRLKELGGSDYKIVEGEENIKGWDVKDAQGNKLGEVDELIFDEVSLKVRYLILDLDDNDLDLDFDDKKVMIPIGMAEIDEKDDDVILRHITIQQIQAMPDYDEDNLDSDVELSNYNTLTGIATATTGAHLYDNEHFSDENLFLNRRQDRSFTEGEMNRSNISENFDADKTSDENTIPVIEEQINISKRQVEKGGFRISSRIEETPVQEDVTLREEHVNIERVPVDRPADESDFNQSHDQEIELRERSEVPVVNKEARVIEEIRINKEVTEREETIHDTVRKTNVNVDDLNDESINEDIKDR